LTGSWRPKEKSEITDKFCDFSEITKNRPFLAKDRQKQRFLVKAFLGKIWSNIIESYAQLTLLFDLRKMN
jgi:hypothetical protein